MLQQLLSGHISVPIILTWVVSVAIAITVHEYAHAKRAEMAGDPTPGRAGRVTLNPLAHYDPIGTTMMLLFGLGWAKPVPVDPSRFKRGRYDNIMVAAWGPISNVLVAAVVCAIIRFGWLPGREGLLFYIAFLNLLLAFFNIVPIPPLDGSHVLEGLLPARQAMSYQHLMGRYGIILLLVVVFTPLGNWVFLRPAMIALRLMTGLPL